MIPGFPQPNYLHFFYFSEEVRQSSVLQNFSIRPVNLSHSIGSRLKQSFANINRSTPVESITSVDPLITEENARETRKTRRKNAILAGASVGAGALLLGALLIGGAFLASSGGSSKNCLLSKLYIRVVLF